MYRLRRIHLLQGQYGTDELPKMSMTLSCASFYKIHSSRL
jgi:hypothetical protein